MKFLRQQTQIDFLSKRHLAISLSVLLIIVSIFTCVIRGLNLGIDFTGGTLVEVGYAESVQVDNVRSVLENGGFAQALVQHFGTNQDVMVRLPASHESGESSASEISSAVMEVLREPFNEVIIESSNPLNQQCVANQVEQDCQVQMRRVEFVGPQVGGELANQGGLAMLYALLGILIYVTFRFEWRFAVGSVIALVHDVVLTVGVFSLLQLEFSLPVLAAVLAVIGYSLNDTIVVYDRIRENFRKIRKGSVLDIMNISINQTLPRTILTSLTTMLVLITLLVLGGEVIRGFSFALFIGVIVGTYSSIFIASPAVMMLKISHDDMMPVVKEGAKIDESP